MSDSSANEKNPAQAIIDFLLRTVEERKNHYPKYSLRALADEIGVNPGILSSVVAGTRKLTYETAASWLQALKVDSFEQTRLLASMNEKVSLRTLTEKDSNQMSLLAYAILQILLVRSSPPTLAKLADLLERELEEIKDCVSKLVSLNLVQLQEEIVSTSELALPRALYSKQKYSELIGEAMEIVAKSRPKKDWALSNTFTFVSSMPYIQEKYQHYVKAAESVRQEFANPTEGDTLYQGIWIIAPISKKLRD